MQIGRIHLTGWQSVALNPCKVRKVFFLCSILMVVACLASREEGLMHVAHSGHRVDLEVLVGANRRCLLDGAPVGERGLSIVEPLIAQLFDVL